MSASFLDLYSSFSVAGSESREDKSSEESEQSECEHLSIYIAARFGINLSQPTQYAGELLLCNPRGARFDDEDW